MKITLKLFASSSQYLPPEARNHTVELVVAEATTAEQIIDKFSIPRDKAHLVLVNGVFVNPADRSGMMLKEGDTLAIWPPIAGG